MSTADGSDAGVTATSGGRGGRGNGGPLTAGHGTGQVGNGGAVRNILVLVDPACARFGSDCLSRTACRFCLFLAMGG